jgi:hypothetical protein
MSDEEVLFTTNRSLEVVPPRLAHVRREGEFNKNYLSPPGTGNLLPIRPLNALSRVIPFIIGFDPARNLCGHILQLNFACEPTEAVGIRREDPPWIWEVLTRDGEWVRLEPSTWKASVTRPAV